MPSAQIFWKILAEKSITIGCFSKQLLECVADHCLWALVKSFWNSVIEYKRTIGRTKMKGAPLVEKASVAILEHENSSEPKVEHKVSLKTSTELTDREVEVGSTVAMAYKKKLDVCIILYVSLYVSLFEEGNRKILPQKHITIYGIPDDFQI